MTQTGIRVHWQPVSGAVRYNVRVAASQRGLPINRAIARGETTAFLPDSVLGGSSWITVSAVNGEGKALVPRRSKFQALEDGNLTKGPARKPLNDTPQKERANGIRISE